MNKEELVKTIRTIPDYPKKGILFYDVTTLFKDPKALHEAGCEVVVHTFCYGGSRRRKELEALASEVFYYPRHTGWMRQLSFLPYIVGSRSDELLLRRLGADDAPVLFEGLHTCRYLSWLHSFWQDTL